MSELTDNMARAMSLCSELCRLEKECYGELTRLREEIISSSPRHKEYLELQERYVNECKPKQTVSVNAYQYALHDKYKKVREEIISSSPQKDTYNKLEYTYTLLHNASCGASDTVGHLMKLYEESKKWENEIKNQNAT